MGREIAPGLDALTDSAQAITGSDAGWADDITQIAAKLKSTNNGLGTAAFTDTGTGNGDVPVISSGKIATSLLDTATTGGSGSAGKIPLLNSQGLIASALLGGSLGGTGLKYIWFYSDVGPGNEQPSDSESNLQDRYRGWSWRPRSNQAQSNSYVDCTTILVILTGGGGSGAWGPPATGLGPGGTTVAGHQMRKGGGGAAGSTAIRMITGITSSSVYSVRVGIGGDVWTGGSNATDRQRGGTSAFGSLMSAGGGGPGKATGDGGQPTAGGAGDNRLGLYLFGGEGHDGTFDRLGAGAGGASFWGGGYSGGGGRDTQGRASSPGAGGGAANGSIGLQPYTFTAHVSGKRGNDGCCLILGF